MKVGLAWAGRAKVYSGRPPYVTWVDPSVRLVVPSFEARTPLPAVGLPLAVTGGHRLAHEPLQLDIPLESLANT
jgi:hypothetical protein